MAAVQPPLHISTPARGEHHQQRTRREERMEAIKYVAALAKERRRLASERGGQRGHDSLWNPLADNSVPFPGPYTGIDGLHYTLGLLIRVLLNDILDLSFMFVEIPSPFRRSRALNRALQRAEQHSKIIVAAGPLVRYAGTLYRAANTVHKQHALSSFNVFAHDLRTQATENGIDILLASPQTAENSSKYKTRVRAAFHPLMRTAYLSVVLFLSTALLPRNIQPSLSSIARTRKVAWTASVEESLRVLSILSHMHFCGARLQTAEYLSRGAMMCIREDEGAVMRFFEAINGLEPVSEADESSGEGTEEEGVSGGGNFLNYRVPCGEDKSLSRTRYYVTYLPLLFGHLSNEQIESVVLPKLFLYLQYPNTALNVAVHTAFRLLLSRLKGKTPWDPSDPVLSMLPTYVRLSLQCYPATTNKEALAGAIGDILIHLAQEYPSLALLCLSQLVTRVEQLMIPGQNPPIAARNLILILISTIYCCSDSMVEYACGLVEGALSQVSQQARDDLCHVLRLSIERNFDYSRKHRLVQWYMSMVARLRGAGVVESGKRASNLEALQPRAKL